VKISNCPFFVPAVGGRYKNTNMANLELLWLFQFGFTVKDDEREVLVHWVDVEG